VTELERQHQIEVSAAVQAYLGFLRPGMLSSVMEGAAVSMSRAQTIDAFLRMHPEYHGSRALIEQQYCGGADVIVRREWWLLVR
jgi:hypothetical protein